MMKTRRRLVLILLSVCMLIPLLGVNAGAAFSGYTDPPYYARSGLAGRSDSAVLLKLYDAIAAGIEKAQQEITIDLGASDPDKIKIGDMLPLAFWGVVDDHPGYYWLGAGYSASYRTSSKNGQVTKLEVIVRPEYFTKLIGTQSKFRAAAEKIVADAGIKSGMSEYERALRLHDALALRVVYDLKADNAHNAWGAVVDGKAVCEGYAEAYQYLLQMVGIQSLRITGYGTDSSGTVGHAWNMVRIDGKYYYTDVTWDDHGDSMDNVYYTYFDISGSEMNRDHVPDDRGYKLPVSTSTEANWFTRNPQNVLVAGNVEKIASLFGADPYVRIRCTGNVNDFGDWLHNNTYLVLREIGAEIEGTTFTHLKDEYHLKVPSYKGKEPEADIIKGDVNGDGTVNAKDLIVLRNFIANAGGSGAAVPTLGPGADMNGDGTVNGKDLSLLRKAIAG